MSSIIENAYIVLLGIGTVFFGLICIVIICNIMSRIVGAIDREEKKPEVAESAPVNNAPIENRQAIIAAVSAVIAEELGESVKNIKVVSFKRV